VLDLAHADDDRSNSPYPNPCAESADDFEARAHTLNPADHPPISRQKTPHLLAPSSSDTLFTIQPGRRQDPKLVSGAKISDATQVVQFTVEPAAFAPKSNINETQSGKVQKTMDQARLGARACLPSTTHTCDPWLYHTARPRVRSTPSIYLRHTTTRAYVFPHKPDASNRLATPIPLIPSADPRGARCQGFVDPARTGSHQAMHAI
jgi:hypothetical protein